MSGQAKMSKAELLAIKAKRKAQRQANTQAPAERPAAPPTVSGNNVECRIVPQKPVTQARPSQPSADAGVEKTQQSARPHAEASTAPIRSSQPQPHTSAPVTYTISGPDGASALPKGFFDDKKSDAIAHGEKPRTAADAEKDLQAFQRDVDQMEEQQMAVAAEEASEAAERAVALEEFENKKRQADLEALKKRQRRATVDERTLTLVKRAREADTRIQASKHVDDAPRGSEEQESDDESDDGTETDVLAHIAVDWRAKR